MAGYFAHADPNPTQNKDCVPSLSLVPKIALERCIVSDEVKNFLNSAVRRFTAKPAFWFFLHRSFIYYRNAKILFWVHALTSMLCRCWGIFVLFSFDLKKFSWMCSLSIRVTLRYTAKTTLIAKKTYFPLCDSDKPYSFGKIVICTFWFWAMKE